jgi:hypothetical protein
MKHIVVCILVALLGTSAAFGTERIRFAQAGQTAPPPPVRAPSIDQTTTSCQIQLRLIGDELHEQLWFHHRSAGCCRAGFPCAMQSELLIATDGL